MSDGQGASAGPGPGDSSKSSGGTWTKVGVVVLALVAVVVAYKVLGLGEYVRLAERIDTAQDWIRGRGAVGVLAFFGLYIVAALLNFATPMTLFAGAVYGLAGIAIVSPASVVAATIAFVLGRFVLRDRVQAKVAANRKFAAVDRMVGKNGFKIVTLLRLSPVFPFTLLNYGLGVTPVKLRDYVLASLIGMLPGTAMYVYIGFVGGAAAETATQAEGDFLATWGPKILQWGVGGIATVAVVFYVTRIARRALRDELDSDEADRSTTERPTEVDREPAAPEVNK